MLTLGVKKKTAIYLIGLLGLGKLVCIVVGLAELIID